MTELSFSMFSKLTHVVESISISFLFMNEYYPLHGYIAFLLSTPL